MTGRVLLSIILLSFSMSVYAQSIDDVRSNFESFEYGKVIDLSNLILGSDSSLAVQDKIELLTMKGIAFYSTAETDSSRAAFIDLLKLSPDHELDPVRISPKIIGFYKVVKSEFEEITEAVTGPITNEEMPQQMRVFDEELYRNSIFRSILLPGFGHLYTKSSFKNWLITTVSAANLGTMIYYIIETNNLEKKYINENNLSNISGSYNSYNNAYRIRNILIGTYAAIWLYSQIDLLFNSEELFIKNVSPGLSVRSTFGSPRYCLDLRISF